jgi:hypothetical protein
MVKDTSTQQLEKEVKVVGAKYLCGQCGIRIAVEVCDGRDETQNQNLKKMNLDNGETETCFAPKSNGHVELESAKHE